MKKEFLAELQKVLGRPATWRLMHPLIRRERQTARRPRYSAWLKNNSHSHPFREIMVVLAGRGCYGAGGDLIGCRAGTFFFFEAGQAHQRGYPPFGPPCIHLWISLISHHVAARFLSVRRGKIAGRDSFSYFKSYPEIGVWPDRCWPEEQQPGLPPALQRARLAGLLSILLIDILRTCLCHPRDTRKAALIKRTIRAIQDHVWETGGRDADLEGLARVAGFSKYHFLRLFRKITGQSVHAFVTTARISRYHQLAKARVAKKEIAGHLGFSCPAAFSRWLRQNVS